MLVSSDIETNTKDQQNIRPSRLLHMGSGADTNHSKHITIVYFRPGTQSLGLTTEDLFWTGNILEPV